MNAELIVSVIATILAFISIVVSTLIPFIKKILFDSSMNLIDKCCFWFRVINPNLINSTDNDIYQIFLKQGILAYGLPRFNKLIQKFYKLNYQETYEALDIQKYLMNLWNERLGILEIFKLHYFWRRLLKKIKNITKILDNTDLFYKYDSMDILEYNYDYDIKNANITLTETFDQMKSYSVLSYEPRNIVKTNICISKYIESKYKNNNRKKLFNKEIKSKNFWLDLHLKQNNGTPLIYSVLINSKNQIIKDDSWYTYKHNHGKYISIEIQTIIKQHWKIINKVLRTNYKYELDPLSLDKDIIDYK